ncbi:integrating conjugative element protein [Erwinia amylovora]|uniref:integrating conjugative element protein n=1 Tax=Erwinia amylovora TaxID=552 RepID=UPI0014447CEF|nr:integrating conjugative element protein [Erwinia amylovora]UDJ86341.1 integrating conjugative element protein [Erwinia amylovora]UDJ97801.1 integrating conjugative element protein [Erwinia amylovora]UDK90139.1 integrating conjugative element protein [Erwinia amylovora]UDK93531.1 integrating conjugative element protein [Erwinia amylovora]UOD74366.1 integrating conjugative element protein [Erwinia amylovora]
MKTTKRRPRKALLCAVLLAGICSTGSALSLTVVGDLGGESTAPLFEAINAGSGAIQADRPLPQQPPESLSIADMLPVSTPEMTPGQVTARPLNLPGMPPVFVVGDDPASRQWLEARAASLRQSGATGMVVNVSNEASLNTLRQLAPGLSLVPVRGGDLARRLQLAHYPVLINASGMQQ